MVVNLDKFQSMIISSKKDRSKSVLNINGIELTMKSSIILLGIEINNKLNFEITFPIFAKKLAIN